MGPEGDAKLGRWLASSREMDPPAIRIVSVEMKIPGVMA
jgi:hypothetical protein